MISYVKRSSVGSYTGIKTKSFTCAISTLPGFFGGSIAVMRANKDDEIVKWPLVGKAWFRRGLTKEQRDTLHDHISTMMDEAGDSEPPAPSFFATQSSLADAMDKVFPIAQAGGLISRYIIDRRRSVL